MAVPTITSIAPTTGLPSGRMRVKIVGTNFRLPTVPTQDYDGDWIRTVRVTFNGENCDAVIPWDSATLWVVTPPYYGDPSSLPDAVDVVVTNLDDAGDPISGETVTETDGFTYKREDLTEESDFTWLSRSLARHLRRNLIDNVSINADPDYSDDPSSYITQIATLPVVMLVGPRTEEDMFRHDEEPQEFDLETGVDTRDAPPYTFIASYDITLVSDSKVEALNLKNLAVRFFHKCKEFQLEDSQGSGNRVTLEIRVDDPWVPTDDYQNKIHRFDSTLIVEGASTDDTYGVSTSRVSLEDVITAESGGEPSVPSLETEPI